MLFIIQLTYLSHSKAEEGIITLDIKPAVSLLLDTSKRSQKFKSSSNRHLSSLGLDQNVLHPNVRSAYSSFIELGDSVEVDRSSMDKFTRKLIHRHAKRYNKNRHLSRYERHYRNKNTLFHQSYDNITLNYSQSRHLLENIPSIPLEYGYGTHYVSLWVGSPIPQRMTLIIDTGSHHSAFPCKGCNQCGERYHIGSYFDPQKSNSYRALSCGECRWEAQCQPIPTLSVTRFDTKSYQSDYSHGCFLEMSYTEGSHWEAFQVTDRVFLGGKDLISVDDAEVQKHSFDFIFGCQTSLKGLFAYQLADGIMGMSQHEATLPRKMYEQGKLKSRIFSMCFRSDLVVDKNKGMISGLLTLGGTDERLNSSPMVYARNLSQSGWFTVYIKKLYLRRGGSRLKVEQTEHTFEVPLNAHAVNSGKGVIIDSGTTDTYLHESLAEPFLKMWRDLTGRPYSNMPIRLTQSELLNLPTILIQLMPYSEFGPSNTNQGDYFGLVGSALDPNAPRDVLLALPANYYMEYSPSKDVYTSRIYFTESEGGVLGANSLMGRNIMFDWENGKIGFSDSSCEISYPSNGGKRNDCLLGDVVVAKSCNESVDFTVCAQKGPEYTLSGKETLTMTIEDPASSDGLSCEDVIKQAEGYINGRCTEYGKCSFTKTCQTSCSNKEVLESLIVDDELYHYSLYLSTWQFFFIIISTFAILPYVFSRWRNRRSKERSFKSNNTRYIRRTNYSKLESYNFYDNEH